MKIYFPATLMAAFLLCVLTYPHPAHAAYDADGYKIEDNNGSLSGAKNNTDDENVGDENANKEDEENSTSPPAAKPDFKKPIVNVTPDMQTTPPQPPKMPVTVEELPPAPPPIAEPAAPAQVSEPAATPPLVPAAVAHLTPGKGNWWHPHPGTKWQIQYAGKLDPNLKVAAYDLDMVETDPASIQQLHAHGVKVICYFSAGSFEGWRPDAKQFPASIMGKPNGWKDEKWLDIRRLDILRPIMKARIDMAAQKGCDAVDPDNVEGFENNSGFPLKGPDQIAYNKMIAELAHADGMAVALKNDLSQAEQLLPYFDFEVNEQCFEYQSCEDALPFIKANKPVFNIEYKGSTSQFCPQANKMGFDSVKKNLNLDAKIEYCR